MNQRIFGTGKRIRLGIWGLGRGMSSHQVCADLNIDIVAGCDYNQGLRENFSKNYPAAFVTDSAAQFLAQDFDAVLLATFCPAHADDAIQALNAGKHVLSEVTAFHTLAEGVRLVEAVERTGKVYQLAENYPYGKACMTVADLWKKGLFGEFLYAEFEYMHECRKLQYVYSGNQAVQPGWTVHSWRSWQHWHYYNTHSLGPVMTITGHRPTRVTALPSSVRMPGYVEPTGAMAGVAPSLIAFDNGALMRNLMASTTNDSHGGRIYGTRGSAEVGERLMFRLGAKGNGPKMEVTPQWPSLREFAEATGHGGGDFWTLYYFAREIFTGEPGPFDIFHACDCTLPGILAHRSSQLNGVPLDVPDFRNRAQRDAYRHDHDPQERFDSQNGSFPADADRAIVGKFTATMAATIDGATMIRAFLDWESVHHLVVEADKPNVAKLGEKVLADLEALKTTFRTAQQIAAAYPQSHGARSLREMLAVGEADRLLGGDLEMLIRDRVRKLKTESLVLA